MILDRAPFVRLSSRPSDHENYQHGSQLGRRIFKFTSGPVSRHHSQTSNPVQSAHTPVRILSTSNFDSREQFLRVLEEGVTRCAGTLLHSRKASRDSTTARKIVYLYSPDDESFSASMQHCTNNSVSKVPTVKFVSRGNIRRTLGGNGRFRESFCDPATIVAFRDSRGGDRWEGWGEVKDARPRERLGFQGRLLGAIYAGTPLLGGNQTVSFILLRRTLPPVIGFSMETVLLGSCS